MAGYGSPTNLQFLHSFRAGELNDIIFRKR